jgi:lysophospholipase L1-like esterase
VHQSAEYAFNSKATPTLSMNTGFSFTCLTLAVLLAGICNGPAETVDIAALSRPALLATGDTARIVQAFARADRSEPLIVAVIGGSITGGAMASAPTNSYGSRVADWWRRTFPKAEVKFVNAGIGATGSDYGAFRARRDLLAHRPDFVVVEYAVNDPNTKESAETLEGLLRQILKQPNQPAVVLLFMMSQGGNNAQEWHSKVGAHYGLPMVSFRDALWPEIKAERLKWDAFMADVVHPNDLGHECTAGFVTKLLENCSSRGNEAQISAPAAGASRDQSLVTSAPTTTQTRPRQLGAMRPLPAPLLTDLYERVALHEAADLKPTKNEGWAFEAATQSWRSDKPGSVLEFEITGRAVHSMHFIIRGPMGRARMQVDDAPPVTRDAWFDQTWGGYRSTQVIARDLKPGPHRVRVELLEEKTPGSEGHEFLLLGLGAAGVDGD